jgi:succinate dehydrogenase / fumarate reductase, flavoprotein subunit
VLLTADTILRSALLRDESRGAHFRADAPDTGPHWQRNIICQRTASDQVRLSTRAVPDIPAALRPALEQHVDTDYHHLE